MRLSHLKRVFWKSLLALRQNLPPKRQPDGLRNKPGYGSISIALSSFCKNLKGAQSFIDFLLSDQGRAVYRKWNYLVTEEEARRFVHPECPRGGTWKLPEGWT
jgi:hypothetical protein